MNPTPALDALLVPPTPQPAPSAPAEDTPPEESFDALLEEATEPPDVETEAAVDEKKAAELLAPLLFFAPPPKPIELKLVEIPKGEAPPIEAIVPPPVEKDVEAFTEFDGTPEEFASTAKEGVKLDRKIFEPVAPEPAPEAQETQEVEIAGTVVAQQEKHVKNTEKTADIAAGPEQKMPEPALTRRFVAPVQRTEAPQPLHENLRAELPVEAAHEVIPVKTLDAATLVETIRSDVSSMRLRGANEASVTIRPENGPELRIDLHVARDGSVQAVARVEKGSAETIATDWPQLQQSLATLGIRMADLSNSFNSEQQQRSFAGNQNGAQQDGSRESRRDAQPNFEEQFNSEAASRGPARQNNQHNTPTPTAPLPGRRWQSWA